MGRVVFDERLHAGRLVARQVGLVARVGKQLVLKVALLPGKPLFFFGRFEVIISSHPVTEKKL